MVVGVAPYVIILSGQLRQGKRPHFLVVGVVAPLSLFSSAAAAASFTRSFVASVLLRSISQGRLLVIFLLLIPQRSLKDLSSGNGQITEEIMVPICLAKC